MKRLAHAPHRLYFFLGALAVLLLFGWWWLSLHGPHSAQAVPLHALLMPLGVFPLFILGFTFTAGPRWLALNATDQYFLLNGATYFAGLMLVLLASSLGWPPLRSSGFALMLSGWLAVTWRWGGLVRASTAPDKKHPQAILAAMCGGTLALAATLAWSAGVAAAWLPARQLAFFGFLLPVFVTVCHRMLPFFTSNVLRPYQAWRPYWLLGAWLSGCAVLVIAGSLPVHLAEALTATALSLSFAYTSWRWGLWRSLQNRLLAMLHLSFAWLTIVFALYAADAFGLRLGSAALHALGLGFMATMLVGFVSRVTYGHSGRPLEAGNLLWSIYLGLHLSAALRVLASALEAPALIVISASAWLILLGLWVALMLPAYLKARVDGQPG
ncbi:MAG: NnrS family protein [Burkholderiales bacterium]|nr:NnrS family protein [Burkholderiales bacterium]